MKYLLSLFFILTFGVSIGQIYNPTPQYVYKYKLGAGRSTPVDTAAYMNIGPNTGGISGIMLPRVDDTAAITGTKRNALLIFSNQLNEFAWWDSTNAVWTGIGSGGTATEDATVLINGGTSIGDTLLVSNIAGDTLTLRSLLAGSGIRFEAMGDTVLKINSDSSTAFNIYNSDGTIKTDRNIEIDSTILFSLFSMRYQNLMAFQYEPSARQFLIKNQNSEQLLDLYDRSSGMFLDYGSIFPTNKLLAAGGLYITHNESDAVPLSVDTLMPFYGVSDTLMYWNPSTGQVQRATTGRNLSTKANSGNATLVITDNYVILSDLTGASARTVTLPTSASGKTITIVNKSSDGALKWTFASTVKDISGATVTAIDDLSAYTILGDGTDWIIINKY